MRSVIRGLRNLIAYAPLIWRDRDWDHSFLLEMLIFKLRRMETAFASDAALLCAADEVAIDIRLCHEALARAWEDDYRTAELAVHEEKWGISCCPKCGELICECFPSYGKDGSIAAYKWVTEYQGAHSEEEERQARAEKMAIYHQQDNDQDNDLKLAFGKIGDRIRWWWD